MLCAPCVCRNILTIMLWAGMAPAAMVGWILAYWRYHFYTVTVANKFRYTRQPQHAAMQLTQCSHAPWRST